MNGFIGSGGGSFRLVRCRFGRNCDCSCGILYAPMLGVIFAGFVSLTFSPYSSELLVPGGRFLSASRVCYVCVCVGLAHLVFYGRENKCVKCRIG